MPEKPGLDFSANSPPDYKHGAYDFWQHGPPYKCFDFEAGG